MIIACSLLLTQFSFNTYGTTKIPEQTKMIVNVSVLNLRSTQEIATNIIRKLKFKEELTVLSTNGDWYLVSALDGQKGYVWGQYLAKPTTPIEVSQTNSVITVATNLTTNSSMNPTTSSSKNSSTIRQDLISYSKQYLGRPYVYGGTSLIKGIDCSSFTQQMLGKFGYKISRTSALQFKEGKKISVNELLPGDLVFYGYFGVVSHVGIYIGDGNIIHGSNPSVGITISGIFSKGRKPFIGCTRVIAQE